MTTIITSLQNPKIKQLMRLKDRQGRDKENLFLIEGYREILRYIENGGTPEAFFFSPTLFLGENEPHLIQRSKATLYECSPQVFKKLSYRERPDGLIVIAKQQKKGLKDLILPKNHSPFLVVAEAIEKPGNLGTILRSSDACGIDGLILCDKCTDLFNPNVVRASVGTLFTVPVFESTTDETLFWLKNQGISIMAATPSAKKEFTQVDLTKPIAIAVGCEQLGLSKKWMDEADVLVKIPMCGKADSLNVAMATTLLLYETLRQRRSC